MLRGLTIIGYKARKKGAPAPLRIVILSETELDPGSPGGVVPLQHLGAAGYAAGAALQAAVRGHFHCAVGILLIQTCRANQYRPFQAGVFFHAGFDPDVRFAVGFEYIQSQFGFQSAHSAHIFITFRISPAIAHISLRGRYFLIVG